MKKNYQPNKRIYKPSALSRLFSNLVIIGIIVAGGVGLSKFFKNQPINSVTQNPSTSAPTSSTPAPPANTTPVNTVQEIPATQPACDIKGNISYDGNKKLYHKPGYPDYEGTLINKSGERWFCSEQEAINAGWQDAAKYAR